MTDIALPELQFSLMEALFPFVAVGSLWGIPVTPLIASAPVVTSVTVGWPAVAAHTVTPAASEPDRTVGQPDPIVAPLPGFAADRGAHTGADALELDPYSFVVPVG